MKREDRRQRLYLKSNVATSLFKQIFIRVSEKQDRLFRVVDEFVHKIWLVEENQRDTILSRNIFGRDDCELVPGDVALKGNLFDATARRWTADGRTVEHFGKVQVVNVARLSRNFVAPLFSRHRPPDDFHYAF